MHGPPKVYGISISKMTGAQINGIGMVLNDKDTEQALPFLSTAIKRKEQEGLLEKMLCLPLSGMVTRQLQGDTRKKSSCVCKERKRSGYICQKLRVVSLFVGLSR